MMNYRSFGEDQNLKNAGLDIQSMLRQAQSSATANVKCNSKFGANWQVELADATIINLKCQEFQAAAILKKSSTLGANIVIQEISGTSCSSALPLTISFEALTGKIDLGEVNCSMITITLKNNKTGSAKSFNIEKGGRIYGN